MKTIPRNASRRDYQAVKATARDCHYHASDNYYEARPCTVEEAFKDLWRWDFSKLQSMGGGAYRVKVTSKLWYDFTAVEV